MAANLSGEEPKKVKEFLECVNARSTQNGSIPYNTAVKFLMARKFDVNRAVNLYFAHEEVRRREGLSQVDPTDERVRRELLAEKFTVLPGRDNNGAVLALFNACQHYPERTTHTDTLKGLVFQLDSALESTDAQRNGLVFIYDMTHSKYANFDYDLSIKILNMLKGCYPARLKKVLIVTAPLWFKAPFKILRLFVREKLRDRVFTSTIRQLTLHVPASCLPRRLGGNTDMNHREWIAKCLQLYWGKHVNIDQDIAAYLDTTTLPLSSPTTGDDALVLSGSSTAGTTDSMSSLSSSVTTAADNDNCCCCCCNCSYGKDDINNDVFGGTVMMTDSVSSGFMPNDGTNKCCCQSKMSVAEKHTSEYREKEMRIENMVTDNKHHCNHCNHHHHHHHHNNTSTSTTTTTTSNMTTSMITTTTTTTDSQTQNMLRSTSAPNNITSSVCNNVISKEEEEEMMMNNKDSDICPTHGQRKKRPLSDGDESIHGPDRGGMDIKEFAAYTRIKGRKGLQREYAQIKAEPPRGTFDASKHRNNLPKNRYTDVLCFDHSRVKLSIEEDDIYSDYINANLVDGYRHKNAFISTQGTLPRTFGDFWRMVWEQMVLLVVMTTRTVERGRLKCGQYWPLEDDGMEQYGDFTVINTGCEHHPDYNVTSLILRNSKTGDSREVTHFQFTSWPDYGVPPTAAAFLDFMFHVREKQAQRLQEMVPPWPHHPDGPPIVIHCSAGIGRTGTFITMDILTRRLADVGTVDVRRTVCKIRSQRAFSIQMPDQYVFCHLALLEHAQRQGLLATVNLQGFEDSSSESEG